MRRLLAATTLVLVVSVNPTADATTRPNPARQTSSKADLQAISAAFDRLTRDPHWRRWIETLTYRPDYSRPCPYERLIRHVFPDWPDAVSVAYRESRCQPNAANPTSSARGMFQLLHSLHAHRYRGACTPTEWSDPWCNTMAARDLYNQAGTSPWALP